MLGRLLTGVPITPTAVAFAHAPPPDTRPHERIFGVLPTFGAVETWLRFDDATLALPVRAPRSKLTTWLVSYAEVLLADLGAPPDDIEGQVMRAVVTGLQDGSVGIEPIAQRLGTTPRTLQRRLAAAGTSFAALVDRARRATAEHHLRDRALPIAEVSFLLGFADPSNFHRAFRRWTGTTPAAYRAASA